MHNAAANITAAADRITAQVRAIVPHHAAIAAVTAAYRSVAPAALSLARQVPMLAGVRAIERATAHVRQALATADAVVARAQYQQEQPDAK